MSRGGGTSSRVLYERGLRVIPGGVNSPVRAFRAVGGVPVAFERGEGAYLIDVDGRRFLDLVMSWGAMILGHAHPAIVSEVEAAVRGGTSFGAPCPDEVKLAEHICKGGSKCRARADGEFGHGGRNECDPTFTCLYTPLKDSEVQRLLSRSR